MSPSSFAVNEILETSAINAVLFCAFVVFHYSDLFEFRSRLHSYHVPSAEYEQSSASQRRRSFEHYTSCSGSRSMNSFRWSEELHEHASDGCPSRRNAVPDGYHSQSPSRRKRYTLRESDLYCDEKHRMPYPLKHSSSPEEEPLFAQCERRRASDYRRSHSPVNRHSQRANHSTQDRVRTGFSPSKGRLPHFDMEMDSVHTRGWRNSTADTGFKPDGPWCHRSRSPYPSFNGSKTMKFDRDSLVTCDYLQRGRSSSPPLELNRRCSRMYDDSDYQCYHRARSRTPPFNESRCSRITSPSDAFNEKSCSTQYDKWTSFSNRRDLCMERISPHHKSQDLLDR